MLPKLFALAYLAVGTLATDGLFHSPKAESFLTVDFLANIPLNVTTPDGTVATVPIRGGEVKGKSFNGRVVENITSATESTLTSTNKWEYTVCPSAIR